MKVGQLPRSSGLQPNESICGEKQHQVTTHHHFVHGCAASWGWLIWYRRSVDINRAEILARIARSARSYIWERIYPHFCLSVNLAQHPEQQCPVWSVWRLTVSTPRQSVDVQVLLVLLSCYRRRDHELLSLPEQLVLGACNPNLYPDCFLSMTLSPWRDGIQPIITHSLSATDGLFVSNARLNKSTLWCSVVVGF